jgi:hypothetical protein
MINLGDGEHYEPTFGTGEVFQLSPLGRMTWERFLSECSLHAGRVLTGDDISAILKQIQAETGERNPQFTEPVIDLFIRHLHELRTQ